MAATARHHLATDGLLSRKPLPLWDGHTAERGGQVFGTLK